MEHIRDYRDSVGLSPVRIYHLNTSYYSSSNCPRNVKCYHNYRFHWHGQEDCQLNVLCSHLGNNVCADHGLTLINDQEGQEDKLRICHSERIYEVNISRTSEFNAQVWHVLNADIDMSCYLWCQDTSLKYQVEDHDHKVDEALVAQLDDFDEKSDVDFDSTEVQTLSSKQVYLLDLDDTKTDCNEGEMCKSSIKYTWFSPFPCQLNFVCSKLTGNICGDYGLNLIKDQDHVPICHPFLNYNQTLNSMESIQIEFWQTEDNDKFNLSCQFWCNSNQNIKRIDQLSSVQATRDYKQESMVFLDQSNDQPLVFAMEPQTIQSLSFDWNNEVCLVSDMCMKEAYLTWLNQPSCQFNLVCSNVEGDVCSLGKLLCLAHSMLCYYLWGLSK